MDRAADAGRGRPPRACPPPRPPADTGPPLRPARPPRRGDRRRPPPRDARDERREPESGRTIGEHIVPQLSEAVKAGRPLPPAQGGGRRSSALPRTRRIPPG